MRITAKICDLCKCDGELVIATHKYRSDVGLFDACEDHAEEVEGYGMTAVPYDHPGDVDPDTF